MMLPWPYLILPLFSIFKFYLHSITTNSHEPLLSICVILNLVHQPEYATSTYKPHRPLAICNSQKLTLKHKYRFRIFNRHLPIPILSLFHNYLIFYLPLHISLPCAFIIILPVFGMPTISYTRLSFYWH